VCPFTPSLCIELSLSSSSHPRGRSLVTSSIGASWSGSTAFAPWTSLDGDHDESPSPSYSSSPVRHIPSAHKVVVADKEADRSLGLHMSGTLRRRARSRSNLLRSALSSTQLLSKPSSHGPSSSASSASSTTASSSSSTLPTGVAAVVAASSTCAAAAGERVLLPVVWQNAYPRAIAGAYYERRTRATLRRLCEQMLVAVNLPGEAWLDPLLRLAMDAGTQTRPAVRDGPEHLDVLRCVKVKKVPGGIPEDSQYVAGLVFTQNLVHKAMPSSAGRARPLRTNGQCAACESTHPCAVASAVFSLGSSTGSCNDVSSSASCASSDHSSSVSGGWTRPSAAIRPGGGVASASANLMPTVAAQLSLSTGCASARSPCDHTVQMCSGGSAGVANIPILLLGCAIEYERVASRLVSFDALVVQEKQFLRLLVARIASLHPGLVLVEGAVARIAQEYFVERSIPLAVCVKHSVLESISRFVLLGLFVGLFSVFGFLPCTSTCLVRSFFLRLLCFLFLCFSLSRSLEESRVHLFSRVQQKVCCALINRRVGSVGVFMWKL
jgi:hypothetical protein